MASKREVVGYSDTMSAWLELAEPGKAVLNIEVDGKPFASIPFANVTRACARLDPDAAGEAQRRVFELEAELARLRSELIDARIVDPHMLAQANKERDEAVAARAAAVSELAHLREHLDATAPERHWRDGRATERRAVVRHLASMEVTFRRMGDELRAGIFNVLVGAFSNGDHEAADRAEQEAVRLINEKLRTGNAE